MSVTSRVLQSTRKAPKPEAGIIRLVVTDVVVQEGDATGEPRVNQQLWHAIFVGASTTRIDLPSDYSAKPRVEKIQKDTKIISKYTSDHSERLSGLNPPPRRKCRRSSRAGRGRCPSRR